ncbi:hypothetical protein D5086_017462 [Populus alba]|uniref:Uncharacterized protein n=1 Tax=Populus alba TaxID=43335 RepID=A0ACC4BM54_POPAL
MSRRGGGRRSETRRDQDSSTPSPSFQRGGGGGGGRGRGGRGGSTPAPSPTPVRAPTSRAPSATAGPSAKPAPQAAYTAAAAASSSSSVGELSQETSKKLTLGETITTGGLVPVSSKAIVPPRRPDYGKIGKKCVIRANHFVVEVSDRDLFHYDVRNALSLTTYLHEPKEFVVKLAEKGDAASSSSSVKKERQFKVAIKYASKVDMYHLKEFLSGRQADAPHETIQILDIVLRASPSEKYITVGRSFFSPELGPKGDLGDGIEYWRGYYQSLRPTQMGLSFNIDVSARSFYEPILVTEFVAKYFNFRDLSRPLYDQERVKVKRALRGIKVQITYSDCTKSYKITDITNLPVNKTMFTLDDKKTKVSVYQYFLERYNIKLKYTSLPPLQAGTDAKPIYLPMELCQIAGGQRYTKKLNERQVTALLRATCQRPSARENNIKQMVRQNDYSRNALVRNEFGIQVKEELTLVDARVLPPPMLKYHDTGREARVDPRFGQWNMIDKKMVNGGRIDFWTCLNFSTRVHRELPPEFCWQLMDMCNNKGMEFNPEPIIPIRSADSRQIEKALHDVHKQCTAELANQKGKQLQLLIIILPDVTGSYGKIKRICETELGIVSQCCQPQQAKKLSKQYLENVALKINVKAGGRNTVLNDAFHRRIPLLTDVPTIVFGADVTHPQAGEDAGPSIAAVVASMDWPEVTKYRGLVSAQAHREEIIEDLYKNYQNPKGGLVHGGMIRELLLAFYRSTGQKPFRIIFYRDGVSEGQFSQVLLHEMQAIRQACGSLEDGYGPPVTFVVVQKRHHTRFFPADHSRRDQTDKSGNILPGTVVDTTICHPTEFDFYLNSHAGIQGTSRPTHYHVLFDENNFSSDGLQTLTNNLCYTYARCTRSVSIVPPAYYAHLAAFRARYYIEGETSDAGSSGGTAEFRPLPVIKENVKDVMFYC